MEARLSMQINNIPVTLLTGFLGSGKTTLLSTLLSAPCMKNTMVIVNELGEIALDHILVCKPADDVLLFGNGCLCCDLMGELSDTLISLASRSADGLIPVFDRIIIELSGLADPIPLLRTLLQDVDISTSYKFERMVTVFDAVNGEDQLSNYRECLHQISVADTIFISKEDLVDEITLLNIKHVLSKLNPEADIYNISFGSIDPEYFLQTGPNDVDIKTYQLNKVLRLVDGTDRSNQLNENPCEFQNASLSHDRNIKTFGFRFHKPVSAMSFLLWAEFIATYNNDKILRIKGLVNVEGKPVVVQAVPHLFHPPEILDKWPVEEACSRLLFITKNMTRGEIERGFAAFEFSSTQCGSNSFNGEFYQAFVKAQIELENLHSAGIGIEAN